MPYDFDDDDYDAAQAWCAGQEAARVLATERQRREQPHDSPAIQALLAATLASSHADLDAARSLALAATPRPGDADEIISMLSWLRSAAAAPGDADEVVSMEFLDACGWSAEILEEFGILNTLDGHVLERQGADSRRAFVTEWLRVTLARSSGERCESGQRILEIHADRVESLVRRIPLMLGSR